MDKDLAMEILRLFDQPNIEGWDLHGFFEFVAGDNQEKRTAVLDVVYELAELGFLENRGSDFYTLTDKGLRAATQGSFDELDD